MTVQTHEFNECPGYEKHVLCARLSDALAMGLREAKLAPKDEAVLLLWMDQEGLLGVGVAGSSPFGAAKCEVLGGEAQDCDLVAFKRHSL